MDGTDRRKIVDTGLGGWPNGLAVDPIGRYFISYLSTLSDKSRRILWNRKGLNGVDITGKLH